MTGWAREWCASTSITTATARTAHGRLTSGACGARACSRYKFSSKCFRLASFCGPARSQAEPCRLIRAARRSCSCEWFLWASLLSQRWTHLGIPNLSKTAAVLQMDHLLGGCTRLLSLPASSGLRIYLLLSATSVSLAQAFAEMAFVNIEFGSGEFLVLLLLDFCASRKS